MVHFLLAKLSPVLGQMPMLTKQVKSKPELQTHDFRLALSENMKLTLFTRVMVFELLKSYAENTRLQGVDGNMG